jgi:hypothetical protein
MLPVVFHMVRIDFTFRSERHVNSAIRSVLNPWSHNRATMALTLSGVGAGIVQRKEGKVGALKVSAKYSYLSDYLLP